MNKSDYEPETCENKPRKNITGTENKQIPMPLLTSLQKYLAKDVPKISTLRIPILRKSRFLEFKGYNWGKITLWRIAVEVFHDHFAKISYW